MLCPSCGMAISDNSTFCRYCGKSIGEQRAPSPVHPQAAPQAQFTPPPVQPQAPQSAQPSVQPQFTQPPPLAQATQPTPAPQPQFTQPPQYATQPPPAPQPQFAQPPPPPARTGKKGKTALIAAVLALVLLVGGGAFAFFWDDGAIWNDIAGRLGLSNGSSTKKDSNKDDPDEAETGDPSVDASTDPAAGTASDPSANSSSNQPSSPSSDQPSDPSAGTTTNQPAASPADPSDSPPTEPGEARSIADDALMYLPVGSADDELTTTLRTVAAALLSAETTVTDTDIAGKNLSDGLIHAFAGEYDELYKIPVNGLEIISNVMFGYNTLADGEAPGFMRDGDYYVFQASPMQELSIHITHIRSGAGYTEYTFAATSEKNGSHYLAGRFSARLQSIGTWDYQIVSAKHLYGQTVWLSYWSGGYADIAGSELLTDSDRKTVGLIKKEMLLDFERPDQQPFSFNGIEIAGGIHDTKGNYDAYAQPTHIEGWVTFLDGDTDRIQLPIDVCAFQGYPTTVLLPYPMEDVVAVTFRIVESGGAQEYMAIGEITIY